MAKLHEVIKRKMEIKGLEPSQVASFMGISQRMVEYYIKGDKKPSANRLMELCKILDIEFSDLNETKVRRINDDHKQNYQNIRRNLKNNHVHEGTPIYESMPSTLTNTELYRDEKAGSPDFWITIPNLKDCNYGTRAKGDSMHPLIRTNALIIGREILDFGVIIFGEIYTVITKNGMETTKYVHPHPTDENMILLVPYNDKAKTTAIKKDEILKLFEAKAVFNNL